MHFSFFSPSAIPHTAAQMQMEECTFGENLDFWENGGGVCVQHGVWICCIFSGVNFQVLHKFFRRPSKGRVWATARVRQRKKWQYCCTAYLRWWVSRRGFILSLRLSLSLSIPSTVPFVPLSFALTFAVRRYAVRHIPNVTFFHKWKTLNFGKGMNTLRVNTLRTPSGFSQGFNRWFLFFSSQAVPVGTIYGRPHEPEKFGQVSYYLCKHSKTRVEIPLILYMSSMFIFFYRWRVRTWIFASLWWCDVFDKVSKISEKK